MTNYLPVSNIFYSIQGEGPHVGLPSVFVRFFGCNLSCTFCDEKQRTKKLYDEASLLSTLLQYPCRTLVCTGGEPTLHNLNPFISLIKSAEFSVHLETNGYNIDNAEEADFICCSPKGKLVLDTRISAYKIVCDPYTDFKAIVSFREGMDADIYIQPINSSCVADNEKSIEACVSFVKAHKGFRLSVQTHKLIRIP